MKVIPTSSSRKQAARAALGARSAPIGPIERLETRELLSSLQPVSVSFQWIARGRTPTHQIQFDAQANCLGATSQLPGATPTDCSLGQFGSAPNRIAVTFNAQINSKSFNATSDVSLSGDLDPSNPFRIVRGSASKHGLMLYTTGQLSTAPGSDLTIGIQDIQSKRPAAWMSPWSATIATDGTPATPPPPGGGDRTAPQVLSITPAPGSVLAQRPSLIEALFSEDLAPGSIHATSFQVIGSGGDGVFGNGNDRAIVATSISYNPATDSARLQFSSPLANDTYQVRLAGTAGGVRDLAGNALADFVATFRVHAAPPAPPPSISPGDITPPVVVNVTPAAGTSLSSPPTSLSVFFSEPIAPDSVSGNAVRVLASGRDGRFGGGNDRDVAVQSVQYLAGTRQLVIGLGESLNEDVYRVVIGDGQSFRDGGGNALDGDLNGTSGGVFTSDFRVDLTAPSITASLGAASDTGVLGDNRTSQTRDIVLGGRVGDGEIWAPNDYIVELDVDLDGRYDDARARTDVNGQFVLVTPSSFRAAATQRVRLRVTDPAGRSSVTETTFTVDATPIVAAFPHALQEFNTAPSNISFLVSETPNPLGLHDLSNYSLIASVGDGVFVDQTIADVSQFITGVSYNDAEKRVTVNLRPGLPNDAYRVAVRGNGVFEDLAGNSLEGDAVTEFRVGNLNAAGNSSRSGPAPSTSSFRTIAYETANPAASQVVRVRDQAPRIIDPSDLILYNEIEAGISSSLGPLAIYDFRDPDVPPNPSPPTFNGLFDRCERLHPSIVFGNGPGVSFGQDPGERSNIEIRAVDDNLRDIFLGPTGTIIDTADYNDTDFYCFIARAGEIVHFEVSDLNGQRLTEVPWLAIWDLGADDLPGSTGFNPENRDRRLISNAAAQRNSLPPQFFGAPQLPPVDSIEILLTGLTGAALDNAQDQLTHPLGTESRRPGDRVYILEVDTDRDALTPTPAVPVGYLVRGHVAKPAPTVTGDQQIIFIDFDGQQDVRGFVDSFGTDILVDVPAFDIRDYGIDPVFTDDFIDRVIAEVRNEFVRVAAENINTGQNRGFSGPASRIGPYSFEILDSRHFTDPGNRPNVIHVHVGGVPGIAGLGSGVVGVAANVDTGNQNTNPDLENALVFSTELAREALRGIAPANFGPSAIAQLAVQMGEVISHEAGHLLGLWHTRYEGFEAANYGTVPPSCTLELDNIADPTLPRLIFDSSAPQGLVTDLHHRFDRYRDTNLLIGGTPVAQGSPCTQNIGSGVLPQPPAVGARFEVRGLEFYEGTADSIGALAWGMTGSTIVPTPPRVLDVEMFPGEIHVVFSEGIAPASLRTTSAPDAAGNIVQPTVLLLRAGGDNQFQTANPQLCGIFPPGGGPGSPYTGDDCLIPLSAVASATGTGESIYDPNSNTLRIKVDRTGLGGNDLTALVVPDRYKLVLRSNPDFNKDDLDPNNPSIVDTNQRAGCTTSLTHLCGFRLDGEIVADPTQRISSTGERFPTGDRSEAGNMELEFVVSDRFTVDADLTTLPAGFSTQYLDIRAAINDTEFASLSASPVRVTVVPASVPYRVINSTDPLQPRQDIIVPDRTHLIFDGNADVARVLFVATPRSDDPTTPFVNESTQGRVFRVDANTGRELSSFIVPLPLANNVGMAFDGGNLFIAEDALGADARADSVFVIDPFTVDPVTGAARIVNSYTIAATAAGGTNTDGLAVNASVLFASDSQTNRVVLLNKSNGTVVGNIVLNFDLVGGVDFDATTKTLWATGRTAAGAFELHQIDPVTGADVVPPIAAPFGSGALSGVGVIGGDIFVADQTNGAILLVDRPTPVPGEVCGDGADNNGNLQIDEGCPALIPSFASPRPNPTALAGVALNQLVVKLQGARIDVAGDEAALIALGESPDNPVVFTSVRDTTILGAGTSTAAPADWMGIVFRQESDDLESRIENAAIRFAGGPGLVVLPNPICRNPRDIVDQQLCLDPRQRLGITQTLSPVTLLDARPSITNVEISSNAEAAIAATPDSFQRSLGISGPRLFWDVDPGIPIVGDWSPATPGDEFGVYQSSTGKVFVDANGDRRLQRTEDLNCNGMLDPQEDVDGDGLDRNDGGCPFGLPGETPVVGNFSAATPGDELATFDRATGRWSIDFNRDFVADTVIPFGKRGDLPVVGDWDGDGVAQIGVFRPRPSPTDLEVACQFAALRQAACFVLDLNNNGLIDGSADLNGNGQIDPDEQREDFIFGLRDDVPLVGDFAVEDINGDGLLNDGLALPGHGPLLNEVTAQIDFNGDGRLVNNLISEDLNGDGFFNPFFEDLNGNGLFNNGVAAPFLDEIADNVDYNGDGQIANILINEDRNGNGVLDDGRDDIGVYRPTTGEFLLDRNGNLRFDPGEQDSNANGREDPNEAKGLPNGRIDINDGPVVFGIAGGRPVVGDWCVDNPATVGLVECAGLEIGVVDASLKWFVDSNGNLKQDTTEPALVFGTVGDIAVPGNWSTLATALGDEFGAFRPDKGLWFIDIDGDDKLDPSEDLDFDGRLDIREDINGNNQLDLGEDRDQDGRLDVAEDLDPDGGGPLLPNGLLDLNDGGFRFTAALRDDISGFVFRNSLNAVWVRPGFQAVPDAHWDDVFLPHVLTGTINVLGKPTPNSQLDLSPTLELKAGMVVKMGHANLNVGGYGATLLIDSDLEVGDPRVIFTSLLDDNRGPSGRKHDTNNDGGSLQALPGDWGGIIVSEGAAAVINGAELLFGGNLRVPVTSRDPQTGQVTSDFASPSPITLNRGPIFATVTNNIIAQTNNLQNVTSPRTLPGDIAAIAVVGAGALGEGPNLPRDPCLCNANPFIRGNNVSLNNGLNGLEIRMTDPNNLNVSTQDPPTSPRTFADTLLETNSRWDDTDITHILLGTLNFASFDLSTGAVLTRPLTLTLASNRIGTFDEFDGKIDTPAESLVLKLGGRYSSTNSQSNAFPGTVAPPNGRFIGAGFNVGFDDGSATTGFTAAGFDLGFGATLIVDGVIGDPARGVPSAPVILTSIRDDSTGPRGTQLEDTNNDSTTTAPAAGDWQGIEFGAWARSFGRISPINGDSLSASFVRGADIRYANTALLLQSQSIEVSGSLIRNSGIAIDTLQGPVPPPAANNPQGIPRRPSEPLIVNNLFVSNGLAYRQVGGTDNANDLLEVTPPRSMFINNTVDRNTAGVTISQRSGPLIMNNSFTNTTGTAVTIDASSIGLNGATELGTPHQPVQVVRNLFFGNGTNGITGTVPAGIGGLEILNQDPLYVSPGAPDFNYRPTVGSPLVDSALSEFGSVLTEFGFVRAPDRDKTGVFRQDHFATPNIGIGQRPWLDVGAIELVDLQSQFPRVIAMSPVPLSNFQNGFGPAVIELEFSEPVTSVGTGTFFVEASGGDQSFLEGNELRLAGQVSAVAGSNGTRWIFVPSSASNFNNFQNELFRVTALGSGATPIVSVATGDSLDGEFLARLPSGDGVEGGDYRATFSIGDVIGRALYVDDSAIPCTGVPRSDPNLQLFATIQAALAAAQPGDFILVCPGVYTGALNITIPVTLESLEGALPKKDAQGRLIAGSGTFISVTGATPAITITNVANTAPMRIGSTRGGVNHGFVITTSPITGPSSILPAGVGIEVIGSSVEIEGNVIVSNTVGIRADSAGAARLPNITNNLIVGNTNVGPTGFGAGGAGIDITSRNREAVSLILNNTVSYNQAGILLREDGQDPLGRQVATVQNNIITSNSLVGLQTATPRANPNVFHNNAWGNADQTANFGGTLVNPPRASDLQGNPVPDRPCTATTTICGNISVNPLFVSPVDPRNVSDRAEFFRISNFEVQSSSKMIDRGRDEGAPTRDFKGRVRTIDVPGVGNETSPPPAPTPDSEPRSVDIGAFEFVPNPGPIASVSGVRSLAGTRATERATDALLAQLGFDAADPITKWKRDRVASVIDEWLDELGED